MHAQPGALTIDGWDGLNSNAPEFVVSGTARDSVLSLLRRHSRATGVPLAVYWAETAFLPTATMSEAREPVLLFSHTSDDHDLLRQAAEQRALGRDSVLEPIGYHSLIITLNATMDSVAGVWSRP